MSNYHLNHPHRVFINSESNYVPMDGRKNGSLTIRTQIWQGNIFPVSQDQSSRNKILGKKYVCDMLFTSRNRIENVLKSDLQSPFRQ